MKAIIASLTLAVSLPLHAQDAAPDLMKKTLTFDGTDFEISELFEYLSSSIEPSPNVVFKGEVGGQRVPRLKVKDVSLGSLFKVIETVADVKVELIDESTADPAASSDPFGGGGGLTEGKRLTSAGVIVVSSKNPVPAVRRVVPARVPQSSPAIAAKLAKLETEVISLAELKVPQTVVIDAIKLTWDAADPSLQNRAKLAYHEPSKLLIVSGPHEAIENAQKVVAAMLPSYRELMESKAKAKAASFQLKPQPKLPTSQSGGLQKLNPNREGPVDRIPKLVVPPRANNSQPDSGFGNSSGKPLPHAGGLDGSKPKPQIELKVVPRGFPSPNR